MIWVPNQKEIVRVDQKHNNGTAYVVYTLSFFLLITYTRDL